MTELVICPDCDGTGRRLDGSTSTTPSRMDSMLCRVCAGFGIYYVERKHDAIAITAAKPS